MNITEARLNFASCAHAYISSERIRGDADLPALVRDIALSLGVRREMLEDWLRQMAQSWPREPLVWKGSEERRRLMNANPVRGLDRTQVKWFIDFVYELGNPEINESRPNFMSEPLAEGRMNFSAVGKAFVSAYGEVSRKSKGLTTPEIDRMYLDKMSVIMSVPPDQLVKWIKETWDHTLGLKEIPGLTSTQVGRFVDFLVYFEWDNLKETRLREGRLNFETVSRAYNEADDETRIRKHGDKGLDHRKLDEFWVKRMALTLGVSQSQLEEWIVKAVRHVTDRGDQDLPGLSRADSERLAYFLAFHRMTD